MKSILNKLFLGSLFLSVFMSNAYAYSFTKDDLIGKWSCKMSDTESDLYADSVVEYRVDGTSKEKNTIYDGTSGAEYDKITHVTIIARWQLKGDELTFDDGIINYYEVDLPYYDEENQGINKSSAKLFMALIDRNDMEKHMVNSIPMKLKFLDKNTYIAALEDENFPENIEGNQCKRL